MQPIANIPRITKYDNKIVTATYLLQNAPFLYLHCNLIQMPDILNIFLNGSVRREFATACSIQKEPFFAHLSLSRYASSTSCCACCICPEVLKYKVHICPAAALRIQQRIIKDSGITPCCHEHKFRQPVDLRHGGYPDHCCRYPSDYSRRLVQSESLHRT